MHRRCLSPLDASSSHRGSAPDFLFWFELLSPQLEIFLSQRAVEMSEEADILSVSQFQLAPAILQGQTKEKMLSLVSTLQELIGRLTSLRMQHLFMILASPRLAFPDPLFLHLEWSSLPLSSSSL